MELHALGEGVLWNILSQVDPEIVHRIRLVCKKWKEIVEDHFKHLQILRRFPAFLSQMGHDLTFADEGMEMGWHKILWDQFECATLQRSLYLSPIDSNTRLVLDRTFIDKKDKCLKEIELLPDPNSEECFKLKCENAQHEDEKMFTILVLVARDPNTWRTIVRSSDSVNFLDLRVLNTLLRKLNLKDFMTPDQFEISLWKIAFGIGSNLEDIPQSEGIVSLLEDPIPTFGIHRSLFEVPSVV